MANKLDHGSDWQQMNHVRAEDDNYANRQGNEERNATFSEQLTVRTARQGHGGPGGTYGLELETPTEEAAMTPLKSFVELHSAFLENDQRFKQIQECSRRVAQKILARFKTGKPSTEVLAKLIADEFQELNP